MSAALSLYRAVLPAWRLCEDLTRAAGEAREALERCDAPAAVRALARITALRFDALAPHVACALEQIRACALADLVSSCPTEG